MKADIKVQFPGVLEGEIPRYDLGDEVTFGVGIQVDKDVTATAIVVQLRWRTEGPGNTDEKVIGEERTEEQLLMATDRHLSKHTYRLPELAPITYASKYVTIVWEVFVTLDIPWSIDPKHQAPIQVLPRGALRRREP